MGWEVLSRRRRRGTKLQRPSPAFRAPPRRSPCISYILLPIPLVFSLRNGLQKGWRVEVGKRAKVLLLLILSGYYFEFYFKSCLRDFTARLSIHPVYLMRCGRQGKAKRQGWWTGLDRLPPLRAILCPSRVDANGLRALSSNY